MSPPDQFAMTPDNLEEAAMRRNAEALWGQWQPSATVGTYDTADHQTVMIPGDAVGCLAVMRHPEGLFLRRFYIAPSHQNQGIGAAVLRTVISEADQMSIPIRLCVLSTNPALRFYIREGFFVEEETAERRYLSWIPAVA